MAHILRVHLLGPVSIEGPGGNVALPTAKVRLLAAYLFWRQGDWLRREELRGMFWGDRDEERAAASLRVALHFLRQALRSARLPPSVLEFRHDAVRVCPYCRCWVDARTFEHNAWKGLDDAETGLEPLTIAASLYRGEFLQGFDAEWCHAERLRLADLHIGVRRALVERLTSAGLFEAALSHARQWLAADSLDEKAHQALMRLYSLAGEPARVVQQFEECRNVLYAELGVPPSKDTIALFRELTSPDTLRSDANVGTRPDTSVSNANIGARPPDETGPQELYQQPHHRRSPSDAGTAPTAPRYSPAPTQHRVQTYRGRESGNPYPLSGAGQGRRSREPRLSRDPLRSARLLLADAEARALKGDVSAALAAMETALETYERLADQSVQSRARLIVAQALLTWPPQPLAADALVALEPALSHYRAAAPSGDLIRALYLAADANFLLGHLEKMAALATEGIEVALRLGDVEGRARLTVLLATAYLDMHRLAEAGALFAQVADLVPCLGNAHDVLRYLVHRAVFSRRSGDFGAAERLAREALALAEVMSAATSRSQRLEWVARFELLVALHHQGKRPTTERALMSSGITPVVPEADAYLAPLFAPRPVKRRDIIEAGGQWLRARAADTATNTLLPTLCLVVEQALAAGLDRKAASWAAVGVHIPRDRGWPGWAAVFYARRAVALARLGRPVAAAVCCRRAEVRIDSGDRLTPAWLAWARGLIALTNGDRDAAEQCLGPGRAPIQMHRRSPECPPGRRRPGTPRGRR